MTGFLVTWFIPFELIVCHKPDTAFSSFITDEWNIVYRYFHRFLWNICLLCHWFWNNFVPFELPHDKTNKIACAPSKDSDQPGHPPSLACAPSKDSDQPGHPPSLIRVFAVRMKKHSADLSLRWAHRPFCWFCHVVAHFSIQISLVW